MNEPNTRDILIEAMSECLQEYGYRSTSTTQIISKTGISRGSLYFHFPGGKEALAVAAIEASGLRIADWIGAEFAACPDAAMAAARMVDGFAAALGGSGFTKGCPVALSALEAGEQEPALRSAIEAVYTNWQRAIGAGLKAHGFDAGNAENLAQLALIQIEGALLLARVTKSLQPLENAKAAIIKVIGEGS